MNILHPANMLTSSRKSTSLTGVLGIKWCTKSDTLRVGDGMRSPEHAGPLTKRSILSTINATYDPLGILSPYMLKGKLILAKLCASGIDWDCPIDAATDKKWNAWVKSMNELMPLVIQRSFKDESFGSTSSIELHHFADASQEGYGVCTYLKLANSKGESCCFLVMGKARIWPRKEITVPRKELIAATAAAKVAWMIKKELEYEINDEIFWTDSNAVLGYIKNRQKRYKTFVANRLQIISDLTRTEQWRHIQGQINPADIASRGANPGNAGERTTWLHGPEFLRRPTQQIAPTNTEYEYSGEEMDERVVTTRVQETSDWFDELMLRISKWIRLKRVVAYVRRFQTNLQNEIKQKNDLSVNEIELAERWIFQKMQHRAYHREIHDLQSPKCRISKTSPLFAYDAFLDQESLLRVGGRMRKTNLPEREKCPVVIPRDSLITQLIIQDCHEQTAHGGRTSTLSEIRKRGLWVVHGNSLTRKQIYKCVTCRIRRGSPQDQKMADLPWYRVQESPPFTYCGVDCFGPMMIKERRNQVKRYGCLFTCMASRAVHVEVLSSLSTDSFINALRRFLARRGRIRHLYSDHGRNFVGADSELRDAWQSISQERIKTLLTSNGGEYISFHRGTPYAHHMGGVWERQIRTVKTVLMNIMNSRPGVLNDEALSTFMVEAESIVNSRPLTVENLNDPRELSPISPSQILSMKRETVVAPPGNFERADLYCGRMWRRAQILSNEFWKRWSDEYIMTLQPRKKAHTTIRNFKTGDVVLVKDQMEKRGRWPLARVLREYPDPVDRLNRKVTVLMSNDLGNPTTKERAVNQLILLVASDESTGSVNTTTPKSMDEA